jgi:glycosyltransferase involved in cell wall biosynthesis
MLPRLGVIDTHPVQYRAPLYQRLAERGNVELDTLFLSGQGNRAGIDPGFGVPVVWNIDLLSGYSSRFLATPDDPAGILKRVRTVVRWIRSQDVIVVHGYAAPWMLFAMAVCRFHKIPYLLRGESHPQGRFKGIRRAFRNTIVRAAVSGCAGGLAIGQLNDEFYRQYGARRVTRAPYSVDNDRFARTPEVGRSELLARWGLDDGRRVVIFCGKLMPRKRPLDLAAAVQFLPDDVAIVFVGDGSLAGRVRAALKPGRGVVTGFVNQAELPSYFHAADVLVLPSEMEPWGLVVNEAMAAGAVPVVSDRVGAAPDLVSGVGEVYPCGDVRGLAAALGRVLARLDDPGIRDQVRRRVAEYSLDRTAAGFEEATLAAAVPSG